MSRFDASPGATYDLLIMADEHLARLETHLS